MFQKRMIRKQKIPKNTIISQKKLLQTENFKKVVKTVNRGICSDECV